MAKYVFMNKNTELFDIEMDKGECLSISNYREENLHLLPIGLPLSNSLSNNLPKQKVVNRRAFQSWWQGRRIPASRDGAKNIDYFLNQKEHMDISLDELSERAYGLSLSDQFWLRPTPSIKWDDVNFFTNPFSEDIGKLIVEGKWSGGSIISPDNTSDVMIKKKWKVIDGVRYLLKGSSGAPWHSEPFREVFSYKLAKIMMEQHYDADLFVVPYELYVNTEDRRVYSKCPNFVTVDTEYVAFKQINIAYIKNNNTSSWQFTKNFFGDHSYVLDIMFLLDYIVLNEDRHFGNFGIIRDTNTGEFLRPAPIFDTGYSLFSREDWIRVSSVEAKPFNKNFDKQISNIDLSLYQDELKAVVDNIQSLFDEVFEKSKEDAERKKILKTLVYNRASKLYGLSLIT